MYPEMLMNMRTFQAEQERRNAQIERRRLAIETGTRTLRRRPGWTALRHRAGDALVFLGERLRGTTVAAAIPLEPTTR